MQNPRLSKSLWLPGFLHCDTVSWQLPQYSTVLTLQCMGDFTQLRFRFSMLNPCWPSSGHKTQCLEDSACNLLKGLL